MGKPHEIAVMDPHKGDGRITWDQDQEGSVAVAEREFNELTERGFSSVAIGPNGESQGVMDRFDPEVEQAVMIGPAQGG